MIKKLRDLLLFTNFSRSQLKAILPQIMEENRKFTILWSIFNIVFWIYCLIMTFSNPLYLKCRTIYIVALAVTIVTLFLSIYAAPKHPWMSRLIAITLDEVLLLAGVLIARNLAPQTIVIFAAVLIVPVWFITESLSNVLLLLFNIFVWALVGSHSMENETYVWVLSNLCIFSVIGVVLGHFVNKARFERYILAETNAELAKTQARYAHHDQLTDLPNRRAYAEIVEQFSKEIPAGCRVVIADINGLKEMNDTKGHIAGDELITGAAECLRKCFKNEDQIYRSGGDEFCIIITDPKTDVAEKLKTLQQLSAGWKGRFVNGISISAGYASAEGSTDIEAVMKAADQMMYVSKRKYYESTGRDRRQR